MDATRSETCDDEDAENAADDFNDWKKTTLKEGETYWGGEPAGDLLTNFLRPAELTLYTTEKRGDLMKNYRLIPDVQGLLKVYQKFWTGNTMPLVLVYADLMGEGDRRCRETAEKIGYGVL